MIHAKQVVACGTVVVNILVYALVNVGSRETVIFDLTHKLIIDLQVEVLELIFWPQSSFPHQVLVLHVFTVDHFFFEGIFLLFLLFLFILVFTLVVSILMIHSIVEVLVVKLFILSI